MRSRSSSEDRDDLLAVGRVAGHRGGRGEITVKVFGGDASFWTEVARVRIEEDGEGRRAHRDYDIEACRGYNDRLVLKLHGVDDASAAAALKGRRVLVAGGDAPELPESFYYTDRLIGLEVHDEKAGHVGRVSGLMPTAGTDLLVVHAGSPGDPGAPETEILIPLAPAIVTRVDRDAGRIEVRLPEGLLELNAPRRGRED